MTPLLLFSLMLTNDAPQFSVAPTNALVGWKYVASNGPATAIGPRLTCSVQHVGPVHPRFGNELYQIVRIIDGPPGSDIRFTVLDRNIRSGYAKLCTNFPSTIKLWLVAAGAAAGQIQGGTNYYWGGQESKRLRWGWSGSAFTMVYANPSEGRSYYVWRFDNGATADGDSGYAAFTESGEYLGPISGGANPSGLGKYQSSGELAGAYVDLIRDYLPVVPATNAPPKPKVPTNVTVK